VGFSPSLPRVFHDVSGWLWYPADNVEASQKRPPVSENQSTLYSFHCLSEKAFLENKVTQFVSCLFGHDVFTYGGSGQSNNSQKAFDWRNGKEGPEPVLKNLNNRRQLQNHCGNVMHIMWQYLFFNLQQYQKTNTALVLKVCLWQKWELSLWDGQLPLCQGPILELLFNIPPILTIIVLDNQIYKDHDLLKERKKGMQGKDERQCMQREAQQRDDEGETKPRWRCRLSLS